MGAGARVLLAPSGGREIMRRAYKHLVLVALVSLFVGLGVTSSYQEGSLAQTAAPKPNIIFILTDDMRKDDLNARYMPQTTTQLVAKGRSFKNAFVSNPLCCPSRATIMRGQYSHNTKVWFNTNVYNPHPNASGVGRLVRLYEGWLLRLRRKRQRHHKALRHYQQRLFHRHAKEKRPGVHRRKCRPRQAAHLRLPYTLCSTPAPRDLQTFDLEKAPRLPSFNEKDVTDKPPWIKSKRRLTPTDIANIDRRHEDRIESLQAVDDLVAAVVGKLGAQGVLSNTYIVFTSDNGWHHGEHRIQRGKGRPYEEDIRVPLLVRGPGVATGS